MSGGAGLALRLKSKIGHDGAQVAKMKTASRQSHEVLGIHRVVKALIEEVPLLEDAATKERAGRGYIEHPVIKQYEAAELDLTPSAPGTSIFIDEAIVAVKNVGLRLLLESACHPLEAARKITV